MDITKADKNFAVKTDIKEKDIRFFDVLEEPFVINGVKYVDGRFRRMPEKTAASVSSGVLGEHVHCAGGRVRFRTDSRYVAINVKLNSVCKMSHFPLTGSVGFDMYVDNKYHGSFIPPFDIEDEYESILYLDGKEHDIIIGMPLYSGVSRMYVGLSGNCSLGRPEYKYINDRPVVYYGSSITQGGCASRPGNSYQAILSRVTGTDYINLGFSGNAKAEDEMNEYIASLDMSVFVLDYDHNAPTCEHLEKTHSKIFSVVRKAHPDIPIIIMTRPKFRLDEDEIRRLNIARKTYDDAVSAGDGNVYFLSGKDLILPDFIDTATVDNCHPNDSGFLSMAKALQHVFTEIFG